MALAYRELGGCGVKQLGVMAQRRLAA